MKLLFKIIFLLIILALIAGGIFLLMFDLDKYRDKITTELSNALNRPVTIEKMAMKLSMVPTIKVSGITIGNDKKGAQGIPLTTMDAVELTVELKPLINKEVKIKDIVIQNMVLNIVEPVDTTEQPKNKSAQSGISMPSIPMNNPYLAQLQVNRILADKVQINYQKGEEKKQLELKDVTMQQLKALSMEVVYHEIPFQIKIYTDIMALIKMKNNIVFNIQANALESSLKVSGNIGDLRTLKNILLNFDFSTENLQKVLKTAGVSVDTKLMLPTTTVKGIVKGDTENFSVENFKLALGEGIDIDFKGKVQKATTAPEGSLNGTITIKNAPLVSQLGLKPMTVKIVSDLKNNMLTVSQLLFNANRSDIISTFKIKLGDKIDLNGNVQSNYFDLADFYENPTIEQTAQKATKSTTPAAKQKSDISWIKDIKAQIDWKMKNFKLISNTEEYYSISARSILSNEQLTINPLQIATSAGLIKAAIRIQNLMETPQLQLTFNGDNIDMDKVKGVHEYIVGSTANITGVITSAGLNSNEILSHLNGTIEMEMTKGKIINKWFNNLPQDIGLITKSKSFSYSQTDLESTLNCAAARLQIFNGQVEMEKSVAVETSTLDIVLSGKVNLPEETLSVTLDPSLPNKPQNKVLGAVQSIRIEGPIDNPSMKLDTQKIIAKGVEKGINKIMEKAGLAEEATDNTASGNSTVQMMRQPLTLCEAALGHKLKGKVIIELPKPTQQMPITPPAPTQVEPEKLTPQEILKKQLIKSLSSAIQ